MNTLLAVAFGHLDAQISPLDFSLWGLLKERVYLNNSWGLEELEHSVENTVAIIDP
jgi:hypothetical protein